MQNNGFLHQYIVLQNVQVCNFHVKDNLETRIRGDICWSDLFCSDCGNSTRSWCGADHQSHGAESNNDFKWTKQVMK